MLLLQLESQEDLVEFAKGKHCRRQRTHFMFQAEERVFDRIYQELDRAPA